MDPYRRENTAKPLVWPVGIPNAVDIQGMEGRRSESPNGECCPQTASSAFSGAMEWVACSRRPLLGRGAIYCGRIEGEPRRVVGQRVRFCLRDPEFSKTIPVEMYQRNQTAPNRLRRATLLSTLCALMTGPGLKSVEPEDFLSYQVGRFVLKPQLGVLSTYDSNVFFRSDTKESDIVTAVSPGIVGSFGASDANHLSIGYLPTIVRYMDNDVLNTVNHVGRFEIEIERG